MRKLLLLVIVIAGLVWAGWMRFSKVDGDPTVTFDTSEIKEDTKVVIDEAKEVLDRVKSSDADEADALSSDADGDR